MALITWGLCMYITKLYRMMWSRKGSAKNDETDSQQTDFDVPDCDDIPSENVVEEPEPAEEPGVTQRNADQQAANTGLRNDIINALGEMKAAEKTEDYLRMLRHVCPICGNAGKVTRHGTNAIVHALRCSRCRYVATIRK